MIRNHRPIRRLGIPGGVRLLGIALGLLCVVSWSHASQDVGYVVIVHTENPTETLSKGKVSQFLLKKSFRWAHDDRVEPIDLTGDSPVRASLTEDIHGRSVNSVKAYWQRQIFSGRAVPPPELPDDSAAVEFVASHPGAIGYVSSSTPLQGVKAITLTD